MESKLNRQQKAMTSLAKPKHKTSLPEKQKTWSNLLNKRSADLNQHTTAFKTKAQKSSPITETCVKKINKSVQCDSSITEQNQNSNSLSVLNPIRTLQFLLKEIIEFPSVQNTGIKKIINEMQIAVEKIIIEYSGNIPHIKSNIMPIINEDSMIPTRDDDYSTYLKYGNNLNENKHFVLLIEKISELENKYGLLTKKYSLCEEKVLNITSERDKLLEKFKELCSSMETFNNREREYLDTITELKSKLMASEKLNNKQETIITNLNKRLSNLTNKNEVKFANEKMSSGLCNSYEDVLRDNAFKRNYTISKFNLDKSKITDNFHEDEVSKLRQLKPTVMSGLKNINSKYLSKCHENNENYIGIQYTEHHQQASAIKQAKIELQQLFERIETQANFSKQLFHSTIIDNEIDLHDIISDEEDNQSNVSNCKSVVTDSSC